MLYARINPNAIIYNMENPLNPTPVELDVFTVFAKQYGIGAKKINFEIQYGVVTIDINDKPIYFEKKISKFLRLTNEEISTWGVEDNTLLEIVANKIGTTITEFISIDDL